MISITQIYWNSINVISFFKILAMKVASSGDHDDFSILRDLDDRIHCGFLLSRLVPPAEVLFVIFAQSPPQQVWRPWLGYRTFSPIPLVRNEQKLQQIREKCNKKQIVSTFFNIKGKSRKNLRKSWHYTFYINIWSRCCLRCCCGWSCCVSNNSCW